MTAVNAPAKVLVTGANGYIGTWIVRKLLDHGFSVRGAVRSNSKGKHLLELFKDEAKSGRFEIAIVPDISAPGAFDEAVKGVAAIEHTASPVVTEAEDPNDVIEPAVKGTVGILESALKFAGPQLKRVVVTSSAAAILDMTATGVLDESHWNEASIIDVREKGSASTQKYFASKTLAEKAAWEFVEKNKSSLTWDLVTTQPTVVFGPILNEVSSPSALNVSTGMLYNALFTGKNSLAVPEGLLPPWVDVRDTAEGHVRALEVPEAGGQRFILSTSTFIWQDWFDAVNALKIPGVTTHVGKPGAGKEFEYKMDFSSEKARTVLGIKFRDMNTVAKDIVADYQARGWPVSVSE